MKLAIVGSRDLTDAQHLRVEHICNDYIYRLQPDLVISGGALGVDQTSIECAERFGELTKEYLPEGQSWYHYKKRNILIAEACTHLLCIRSSQSKSYGSGWTADYAEKLGKTVWRETV